MERTAITLRLSDDAIARLEHIARSNLVSRQTLMEKTLTDFASTVDMPPKLKWRPLPQPVQEAIDASIGRLKSGVETSLRKLVGHPVWDTLEDPVKRSLGKEFKELVIAGEFPKLKKGRLKSNNEQQYDRA